MEVRQYFFSKDNLNRLNQKLGQRLDVEDRDGFDACRELLKSQMKNLYEQNNHKLGKAPMPKVLKYLNENSVRMCEKIYNDRINKRSQGRSMGQVSMDRESDIHGNRQNRVERRPRNAGNGKRNTSNELDGIDGGGSFAGFAPVPSGNGEFMAADGSMGEKFMTGVNNNDFIQAGDKKQIASELERRMLERSGGYDGGNNMMGGGGNMMGGNNYNPMTGGGNQRPPEIDFSLDGSGIKKSRDPYGNALDESNVNMDGMDPMMMGMMGGNMMGGNMMGGNMMGNQDMMNMPNMMMSNNMMDSNMGGNQDMMSRMSQYQNDNMGGNMNNLSNQASPQNTTNPANMNQMMMQFMQMMSQMMGQNNSNLQMGGSSNDEMDGMMRMNNELKTSVANQLGINPQSILNMSSDEIERLVNRASVKSSKSNRKKYNSDSDSDSSSSDESVKKKSKNKKKKKDTNASDKLKALLELKAKNFKTKNNLNSAVSNVIKNIKKKSDSESSKSDSSSESSDSEKSSKSSESSESDKKSKKKPQKKIIKNSEELKSESDSKITKKQLNKKTSKISTKTLVIESNLIEDDCKNYNDYFVDFCDQFGGSLKNISDIEIVDISINSFNELTETNNNIKIINAEGVEEELEFPPEKYTIDEIIEAFNDGMNDLGWNIEMSEKKGIISIINTDDDDFEINCIENSIFKNLGFYEESYADKHKYIGELKHSFVEKPIYLYIKNISNNEPFGKINPDGTYEKLRNLGITISNLDGIIIQFRSDKTSDETALVNLAGIPHKFTLSIKTSD